MSTMVDIRRLSEEDEERLLRAFSRNTDIGLALQVHFTDKYVFTKQPIVLKARLDLKNSSTFGARIQFFNKDLNIYTYPQNWFVGHGMYAFLFTDFTGLYAIINSEVERCVFSGRSKEQMTPGEYKRKKLFLEKYGVRESRKKAINEHPIYMKKY